MRTGLLVVLKLVGGGGTGSTRWNSGVASKGTPSLTQKLVRRKEVGVGRLSV